MSNIFHTDVREASCEISNGKASNGKSKTQFRSLSSLCVNSLHPGIESGLKSVGKGGSVAVEPVL